MNVRRLLLCVAIVMVPVVALAGFDPAAMRQKYVVGATYHTMGFTGAEARNADGIAGDELLIGYTSMWQVLRWDSKSGNFAQAGFFENSYGGVFGGGGLVSVHFADFDHRGRAQVAVLGEDGRIGRFDLDGTLPTPLWTPAAKNVVGMLVADLDGQPGDEILLQSCSELTAWKFGAAAPLWRIPMQRCEPMLLAQLDNDPQLELVLGSGTVIDTKTLQTQWRYPIGFGAVMTAADLDGDGIAELIGCGGRQCDAFDILHQTTLWETFLPYPFTAGALAAGDVDSTGKAEIFEGDSQHGEVRKIDGMTGNLLQGFTKQGGATFVLVADLLGDCSRQVVWAKDGDSTALDTLHVTDAVTMKTFWSSVPEERGSSGVIVADFSGTGHPSILWSSRAGSIERFVSFNPPGRAYRELSGTYGVPALYLGVSAAAQLDSDPAIEYVLPVVGSGNGGEIGVYDGATHQLQWSLPVIPPEDTLSSMTTGDLTGDGIPDIVIGSGIVYFPASHPAAVVAVDGATRKILWRTTGQLSHLLDSSCLGCVTQVKIADLDLNGSKQVLALVPSDGLYAFDGRTGALLWHALLGAEAFTVADVDPSPGAEIIVTLADGRIAVFDSSGSKLIRAKDLSRFGVGTAVAVADLDGDGVAEIVLVADAGLMVLSTTTLDVLWSGGFVLPAYSLGNQIAIADVDGDSTPEIVVSSAHSLRVFEYRPNKADAVPPVFSNATIRPVNSTGCCRIAFEWESASDAASMPVTYRIYRSLVPGFTPAPSSRIGEGAENAFVDHLLVQGPTYYYAVTAVDSAGNESTQTLRLSATAPSACPVRRRAARP